MPKLYIVPTPIGNLEDITLRAIRILKEVDCILAEDTRTSAKLLKHYEITTPLISNHKFNEHQRLNSIVEQIKGGRSIAMISDAGTPGISDPGFLLSRECARNEIEVECLPGATALIPALVASGLPCDKFCFEGFLPQKKGRVSRITELSTEHRTIVFYESPYRVVKLLTQVYEIFGEDRDCAVCREITKLYEETFRGTITEAIAHFTAKDPKGEFVVIIGGAK